MVKITLVEMFIVKKNKQNCNKIKKKFGEN